MSCYEWSHGTIKLPSAEYAGFRQHVALLMGRREERHFEIAQRVWQGMTAKEKRDPEEYLKKVNALALGDDLDLLWKLQSVVTRYHGDPEKKPRRLIRTDFNFPTNRTLSFHESDLSLHFDPKAKTVTYEVGENNHAREHAEATTLARAFGEAISKVKWTHGTGGIILGNDEYNREAGYENEGGGGSYVVAAYGYIGAQEAPSNVSEFLTTKGWKHVETTYSSRTGQIKGKIVDGRKPPAASSYGRYGRY